MLLTCPADPRLHLHLSPAATLSGRSRMCPHLGRCSKLGLDLSWTSLSWCCCSPTGVVWWATCAGSAATPAGRVLPRKRCTVAPQRLLALGNRCAQSVKLLPAALLGPTPAMMAAVLLCPEELVAAVMPKKTSLSLWPYCQESSHCQVSIKYLRAAAPALLSRTPPRP